MPAIDTLEPWWSAVQSVADLVIREGFALDVDGGFIRGELERLGFDSPDICRAMDWVEHAALSGSIHDVLGMLLPESASMRVRHPLEKAAISERLYRVIDQCRRRGLLNQDLCERLLECARRLDTRNWGKSEIEAFMADVFLHAAPSLSHISVFDLLDGEYYRLLH